MRMRTRMPCLLRHPIEETMELEIVDAHMHLWTPQTHPWVTKAAKEGGHPAGSFGKQLKRDRSLHSPRGREGAFLHDTTWPLLLHVHAPISSTGGDLRAGWVQQGYPRLQCDPERARGGSLAGRSCRRNKVGVACVYQFGSRSILN